MTIPRPPNDSNLTSAARPWRTKCNRKRHEFCVRTRVCRPCRSRSGPGHHCSDGQFQQQLPGLSAERNSQFHADLRRQPGNASRLLQCDGRGGNGHQQRDRRRQFPDRHGGSGQQHTENRGRRNGGNFTLREGNVRDQVLGIVVQKQRQDEGNPKRKSEHGEKHDGGSGHHQHPGNGVKCRSRLEHGIRGTRAAGRGVHARDCGVGNPGKEWRRGCGSQCIFAWRRQRPANAGAIRCDVGYSGRFNRKFGALRGHHCTHADRKKHCR